MDAKTLTVQAIARLVGGKVEGDGTVAISGVGAIESAGAGEITFAADQKRVGRLTGSKASAAIVPADTQVQSAIPLIRVDNVQAALAKLLAHFAGPEDLPPAGVHSSAVIAADAQVDPSAAIGPGVVIGPRAKIAAKTVLAANVSVGAEATVGEDCRLAEGVVVKHGCRIGKRVRIGPNSVIGWDGFGYYFADGVHHKIPHIGDVVIEDDVELGACVTVDRAKFGSTRIGAGTKIDNLVQIAHNVQIGKGCIIAALAGIAGSTKVGDHVIIMGHAGLRDNITIGDNVQCAAYCAVASDVASGEIVAGIPARPAGQAIRIAQAEAKLPDLLKRVKDLETRLDKIEPPKDH